MSAVPADVLRRSGVVPAADLVDDSRARIAVPEAFDVLLDGGLRRGTITVVDGPAATSTALALASVHDGWTAVVGLPSLGPLAARDLGCDLGRLALVPHPGRWYAEVVATLLDAFDVVIASPTSGRDARKLAARVRERDAVLVAIGSWGTAPETRLHATTTGWEGTVDGHGHLRRRTVRFEASSRRNGVPRTATLWLPDADGRITPAPAVDERSGAPFRGAPDTTGDVS